MSIVSLLNNFLHFPTLQHLINNINREKTSVDSPYRDLMDRSKEKTKGIDKTEMILVPPGNLTQNRAQYYSKNNLSDVTVNKKLLKKYDDAVIAQDTHLILRCNVFDGVGDIEHLVMTVRCLKKRLPQLKMSVWLERGDGVPDNIWDIKLKELKNLGVVNVYQTLPGVWGETEEQKTMKKELAENKNACCLFVSLYRSGSNYPKYGIREYCSTAKEESTQLVAGLTKESLGFWIKDDPVLNPDSDVSASVALNELLYGGSSEKEAWDIGFASLRTDTARLSWIEMRLMQVDRENCSLVVSSPKNDRDDRFKQLAEKYHFNECVVVDKNGGKRYLLKPDPTKKQSVKTLRIIHQFIEEQDMPALYSLAKKGSLGGAGDHSMMRSLYGDFPMFIDMRYREELISGPEGIVRYKVGLLKKMIPENYTQLHQWLEIMLSGKYDLLLDLVKDKQLLNEWNQFRTEAVKDADLGPWVERYVKYCIINEVTRPWLEE